MRTAEPQRLVEDLTVRLPLHYPPPDARAYRVLADRTYRTVSGHAYPLDVYQPASLEKDAERPAVVIVHGQAHPSRLREAKAWPALQGLARVLAARGMVAVVPNLGSSASGPEPSRQFSNVELVADNLVTVVRHVQAHALALRVDRRRIGLWVASEGGLYALGPALGGEVNGAVRCAVALYPRLSEARLLATRPALPDSVLERLRPSAHLRRHRQGLLPLLIVRAGRDDGEANRAIDEFVELAREVEAPVTLVRHDEGHHGFEAVDATDQTQAVLDRAIAFLERYL